MTALPKTRMTVDQYLAWARDVPGRYELVDGEIYAMSPESTGHGDVKFAVQTALLSGLRSGRLSCHMLPDGQTVRVADDTAFEPDALVYCGPKLPASAMEVPAPVIVVEVLSPPTGRFDMTAKLVGYFKLPSVAHYLIVDPGKPLVIHHARSDGGDIVTRIVTEGAITLDPPGFSIALAEIYAA
jgi:Uma2 family endonuclease